MRIHPPSLFAAPFGPSHLRSVSQCISRLPAFYTRCAALAFSFASSWTERSLLLHPSVAHGFMSLSRRPTGLPSTPRARTFTAGQATPRRGQDIITRPGSSASERPPPSSYQFQSQEPPPLPSQGRTLRPARSIGAISIRPTGSARSRSLDRRADPRHDSTYSEPPPPLPAMPSLPRGTKLAPSSQRGRDIPAHSVSQSVDYTASRSRYGGEERGRAMPAHSTSQSVDHKGHRSRYRAEEAISDSASSSGASDISGRSPTSAASSRTSIDEADMEDKMEHKTPAGAGSSLWASITGVASNLTISVSKAWSSNIQSYNGEGACAQSLCQSPSPSIFTL